MDNKRELKEQAQSPGAGAGLAGNPQPREHEEQAVKESSSYPGTEEHAAGMDHRTENNSLLDWGDSPAKDSDNQRND